MARYRKIDVRVHRDERFLRLSAPPPCGRYLWFHLLTSPTTTNIPGLFCIGEAGLAEEIGWPLEGFREAFREVLREGLAKADWKARVVWLPKAIRYHKPESPNVVRSWRTPWDELPDCPLKREAYLVLKAFTEELGKGFPEAFAKACGHPSPNQEQEQEQEQEQKKNKEEPARVPLALHPSKAAPDPRIRRAIDVFAAAHIARLGQKYLVRGGRDGKALKGFLAGGYDLAAWATAVDRYFADRAAITKLGASIPLCVNRAAALLAGPATGTEAPAVRGSEIVRQQLDADLARLEAAERERLRQGFRPEVTTP